MDDSPALLILTVPGYLAGIALRLDNVISQVDSLPLLADARPAQPSAPARTVSAPASVPGKGGAVPAAAPAPDPSLGQRMTRTWRAWSRQMWDDVRQLIQVRTVDNPDALMLSPSQSYFVRENLKLRLLNARLALLSRNQGTFHDDINDAEQMLSKYFDTQAGSTRAAIGLLRQVQSNNVSIDVPDLSDSLNAVRSYKAQP